MESVEDRATKFLRRDIPLVAASAAVALLAGWLPHYLTWPWWSDLDAYATMALGWERGVRPYRDVVAFNFPGQIELFWLLGKLFGWGRTWPIYAFDAALLLALGGATVVWSRRRFETPTAGLIGFIGVLSYYLGVDYRLVAQRDWQGPVFAAIALLLAQSRGERSTRALSAAAFACGFAIRPHAVLFLPAILFGVYDASRLEGRGPIRPLIEWGTACSIGIALWFSPIIAQGLLDDLIGGVRIARYGGGYAKVSGAEGWAVVLREISSLRTSALVCGLLLLGAFSDRSSRRLAVGWLLAITAAVAYRPLHPVSHEYLGMPLRLFGALGLGTLAGLIVRLRIPACVRAAACAGLLITAYGRTPEFCSYPDARAAILAVGDREEPARPPIGARWNFPPRKPGAMNWWVDYRRVLPYLRTHTSPQTPVAVLLRNLPPLAINGPTARSSPFPAESGILWLWQVGAGLEDRFVASLERAGDSVVVWVPDERSFDPGLQLPRIETTVRRLYRPEAKFGRIEIWRRLDPAGEAPGRPLR